MKRIATWIFLVTLASFVFFVGIRAQEKAPSTTPTISDQDQQSFQLLKIRLSIQTESVSILQKEVDSTNAELGRFAVRLQKAGYSITQGQDGRLTYVADPKPEAKK